LELFDRDVVFVGVSFADVVGAFGADGDNRGDGVDGFFHRLLCELVFIIYCRRLR
jgi:hypothetical protein